MSTKPAAVLFALRAVNQSKAAINQMKGQLRSLKATAALTARTLGFHKVRASFTNLKKSLSGIVASSGMMGGALRGALAPLAMLTGVGGVAALWRMVSGTTALGDSLAKMSKRTGIAVETLQELKFGAEREGVDAATFAGAMKDFNKNIGEARNGVGEALPLFTKLGIELNDGAGHARTNKEILDDLSDAMSKIKDPATEGAIAQKIMGESGGKMALLLAKGREGMAEYGVEARRLGIITAEQAAAAEGQADQMSNLSQMWSGLSATISAKLMPILGPLIKRFTDWAAANRDLISTHVGDFIKSVVQGLDSIDWQKVLGGFKSLIGVVISVKDFFGSWGKMILYIVAIMHTSLIASVVQAVWALGQLSASLLVTIARMGMLAAVAVGKMVYDFFLAMKFGVGIMRALDIAMAANPIGLLVVALAAAAGLIYAYWDPIKEFFAGFDFLSPIRKQVQALAGILPDWVSAKLGLKVSTTAVAGAKPDGKGGQESAQYARMMGPPAPMAAAPSVGSAAQKSEVTVKITADNMPNGMGIETSRPRGDASTKVEQNIGRGAFALSGT